MTDIKMPFGMRADDRRIVSVQSVERGLDCGCVCPDCEARLVAVKGDVLRHHFRHHADNCGGGRETAMHKFTKQIICDELRVSFPNGHSFGVMQSAEQEVWLDGIRPDVLAHFDGEDVAIEIHVAHAVQKPKIDLIRQRGLCTVEINLWRYWDSSSLNEDELRKLVLQDAKRHWVYPPLAVRQAREAELAAQVEDERLARLEEIMRARANERAQRERDIIAAAQMAKTESERELMREEWRKAKAEEEAERERIEVELAKKQRIELVRRIEEDAILRAEAARIEAERQPPDLQELVVAHGTYPEITEEAWQRFHRDMDQWKLALRHGDYYQR